MHLGRPNAQGRPSWSALLDIIRKYNPASYMNGHDHSMAIARDANKTVGSRTAYLTQEGMLSPVITGQYTIRVRGSTSCAHIGTPWARSPPQSLSPSL